MPQVITAGRLTPTRQHGRNQSSEQQDNRTGRGGLLAATLARTAARFLEQRLGVSRELPRTRVVRPTRSCERFADRASMTSTMFTVKPSRDDPTELHEQVAAQIRRAIADGEATPGDRLPPARDLAAVLGVNRNTVLRALRALRDEGLVDFTRGRGVTVSGTRNHSALVEQSRALVNLARQHGYTLDELIQVIETAARQPTPSSTP
ncbi:MAG TPA: GntR family transcriptional regulator [Thermoleophilaceae bacterium]|nr:GntR family transcriptional regulator [Thermoleophilaceae bacterium]